MFRTHSGRTNSPHLTITTVEDAAVHTAVQTLMQMMEDHHPETAAHMERVGVLAAAIGSFMNLPLREIRWLRWGGMLHDIGKLSIAASVLQSTEPLSRVEQHRMQRQPAIGLYVAQVLPIPQEVLLIIHQHRERLDGSGYPNGLLADECTLLARIVAVADAFDAMTHPRAYRVVMSVDAALTALQLDAGVLWNAEVVAALAAYLVEADDAVSPPARLVA